MCIKVTRVVLLNILCVFLLNNKKGTHTQNGCTRSLEPEKKITTNLVKIGKQTANIRENVKTKNTSTRVVKRVFGYIIKVHSHSIEKEIERESKERL